MFFMIVRPFYVVVVDARSVGEIVISQCFHTVVPLLHVYGATK